MSLHEFDSVRLLLAKGDSDSLKSLGQNIAFSTRREYPVFCGSTARMATNGFSVVTTMAASYGKFAADHAI